MATDDLKEANARLNARALEQCRLEIKHFLCPILQIDEDVPLCRGHVIPEALGDSGAKVLQRSDVDNFYGTALEADFSAAVEDLDTNPAEIFANPKKHKQHRPTTELGNVKVEHYFPKDESQIPDNHLKAIIEDEHGNQKLIALKISLEEARKLIEGTDLASSQYQGSIALAKDYIHHALGAAIKIAHLTMFRLFEYRWMQLHGGQHLAEILSGFYFKHKGARPSLDEITAYFSPYSQMVKPFIPNGFFGQLRGTLHDDRCVLVYDKSEIPVALGIIAAAQGKRFMVFTYPSLIGRDIDLERMEFDHFIANPPDSIGIRIVEWTDSGVKIIAETRANYEPNSFGGP